MKKRILSVFICIVMCLSMATFAIADTPVISYREMEYTSIALEYNTEKTVTGELDAENATSINGILREDDETEIYYADSYAVELKAGDTVTALATFADSATDYSHSDGYIYLLKGLSGSTEEDVAKENDDYYYGSTTVSALTHTATADGTYYVVVTTYYSETEGDYTLTLAKYGDMSEKRVDEDDVNPIAVEIGKKVSGKLDLTNASIADSDFFMNKYSFTLGTGEAVNVSIETAWPGYIHTESDHGSVSYDSRRTGTGEIETYTFYNDSNESEKIVMEVWSQGPLLKSEYSVLVEKINVKGDFVIDIDNKTLLSYVGESDKAVIPDGIVEITEDVFSYNPNVTSVTIPASVNKIDDNVFYYCEELTVINIDKTADELKASKIDVTQFETDAVIKLKDGTEIKTVDYTEMTYTELKPEYNTPLTVKGTLDIGKAQLRQTLDGSTKYYSKGYSVKLKAGDTLALKGVYADGIEADKNFDYSYTILNILDGITGEIDADHVKNTQYDWFGSSATLAYTAPADGTYYILLSTQTYSGASEYSLTLRKYQNLTENVKAAIPLELNKTVTGKLDAQNASVFDTTFSNVYTFTLGAGEFAYIEAEAAWPNCINVSGDSISRNSTYTDTGMKYYARYYNDSEETANYYFYVGNYYYFDEIEYTVTSKTYKPEGDFVISSDSTLIAYLGDETDVVIPDGVKEIANGVFYSRNITSVKFPDTLEIIGNDAFEECSYLTEVTIPASVKEIGYDAFTMCESLEKVTLNEGLEIIGDYAFEDCYYLETINIPSTVKSIGNYAFEGCRSLTSISIPASVKSIGGFAFVGCRALETLVIPEGVESIGEYAFYGCHNVTELSLPSTLTYVGRYAFVSCYCNISIDMTEEKWNTVDVTGTAIYYEYLIPDYVDSVYAIEVDGKLSFDSVTEGYSAVAGKTVTVKNIGNVCAKDIKVTGNTNFTVSLSKTELAPSETATLTIAPKTGLKAGTYTEIIKIETADGATDTVEVTFTVAAKPADPETPDDGNNEAKEPTDACKVFTDVKHESWYEEYVSYVYDNGLMNGTSKTTFEPNTTLSRAMIVTVIARMSGADIDSLKDTKTQFTDVATGKWYSGAVAWAVEKGITTGTTDTTFSPEDDVTRQDTCVFLVRYAEKAGITLSDGIEKKAFPDDAKMGSWAKDAVYTCQQAGIINGTSEGTFDPRGNTTRNAAAKMIAVFYENYIA